MTDLSGYLNLFIVLAYAAVFVSVAARAETKALKYAMFVCLGLEGVERGIIGILRLVDPTGEALTAGLAVVNPIRAVLIVALFGLAAAILSLDRPSWKEDEET